MGLDVLSSVRGLSWGGLDRKAVPNGLLDAFLTSRGQPRYAIDLDLDDALFIASCQPNFDAAVTAIADAIQQNRGVFVFGDYDVDGMTSTSMWVLVCRAFGARVEWMVPTRAQGYGLSAFAAAQPRSLSCGLMICVDSGTDRVQEIEIAKGDGISTVVIDHHLPKGSGEGESGVSRPDALVNGHFSADPMMSRLCAAGQTYAVTIAVLEEMRKRDVPCRDEELLRRRLLQYAMVGTISDMMELVGYNRSLVSRGLKSLNERGVLALEMLIQAMKRPDEPQKAAGVTTISHGMGPAINAAGRYSHPEVAVELLTSDDPDVIQRCSLALVQLNERRKDQQKAMLDEAMERLDRSMPIASYVGENWEKGLVGLVAGGVTEALQRPALVGVLSGDIISGSGRSIPTFDLGRAVIAAHQAGLLVQGGGHAMACGFQCKPDRWAEFLEFIMRCQAEDQTPVVHQVDFMADRRAIIVPEVESLSVMGPFGNGWAPPLVGVPCRIDQASIIGKNKDTLRMNVGFKAIAFKATHNGLLGLSEVRGRDAILIGSPGVSEFQGIRSAEVIVRDVVLV